MKTKNIQYITKGDTTHIFFCRLTLGTVISGIDSLFYRYSFGGSRRFLLPSKRVIFHKSMRKCKLGTDLYILESIIDKEFLVKGLNNLRFEGKCMYYYYNQNEKKLIRKSGIKIIDTERTYKHVLNLNKFKGKEEKSSFLEEQLGDFYKNTRCEFKACRIPKRPPNFVSYTKKGEVSSVYWYGYNRNGYYVIRLSDHWCRVSKNLKNCNEQMHGNCDRIASCWWSLVGNSSTMCGKAYKSDFTKIGEDPDHYEMYHSPAHTLI